MSIGLSNKERNGMIFVTEFLNEWTQVRDFVRNSAILILCTDFGLYVKCKYVSSIQNCIAQLFTALQNSIESCSQTVAFIKF